MKVSRYLWMHKRNYNVIISLCLMADGSAIIIPLLPPSENVSHQT